MEDGLSVCRPTTSLDAIAGSTLVFEAIIENKNIKLDVLKKIDALCPDAYYLTNTSSIPIGVINEGVPLNGRIIGYHFYNPPAVQKLLELITPAGTSSQSWSSWARNWPRGSGRRSSSPTTSPASSATATSCATSYMRRSEVKRLSAEFGETEAIYMMNRVSQDFLVRPMGIFQLSTTWASTSAGSSCR